MRCIACLLGEAVIFNQNLAADVKDYSFRAPKQKKRKSLEDMNDVKTLLV